MPGKIARTKKLHGLDSPHTTERRVPRGSYTALRALAIEVARTPCSAGVLWAGPFSSFFFLFSFFVFFFSFPFYFTFFLFNFSTFFRIFFSNSRTFFCSMNSKMFINSNFVHLFFRKNVIEYKFCPSSSKNVHRIQNLFIKDQIMFIIVEKRS